MKSYLFDVVVERDGSAWHAYCPALERWGAATWGRTQAEAAKHIREVVGMVVAELVEDGVSVPSVLGKGVHVSSVPQVAVTV
jgi:predicted RNase H-like HicB family nuclease